MVACNVTDQRSRYCAATSNFSRSSYTQMYISEGTNLRSLNPSIALSNPVTGTQVTTMAVNTMPIIPINIQPVFDLTPHSTYYRLVHKKQYELKDHLGNVRAIIATAITPKRQTSTQPTTPPKSRIVGDAETLFYEIKAHVDLNVGNTDAEHEAYGSTYSIFNYSKLDAKSPVGKFVKSVINSTKQDLKDKVKDIGNE